MATWWMADANASAPTVPVVSGMSGSVGYSSAGSSIRVNVALPHLTVVLRPVGRQVNRPGGQRPDDLGEQPAGDEHGARLVGLHRNRRLGGYLVVEGGQGQLAAGLQPHARQHGGRGARRERAGGPCDGLCEWVTLNLELHGMPPAGRCLRVPRDWVCGWRVGSAVHSQARAYLFLVSLSYKNVVVIGAVDSGENVVFPVRGPFSYAQGRCAGVRRMPERALCAVSPAVPVLPTLSPLVLHCVVHSVVHMLCPQPCG